MHADSSNNNTSDLLIYLLKNFQSTIFFLHINFYNIVISSPFDKWGTQDPQKLVNDTETY